MNKTYRLTILGAAIAGILSPLTNAQNSLEEIVVTAQKRSEGLQETPIAITAFTAGVLEDKGVSDLSEIANYTPNLVFDTTSPIGGLSSGAAVFIRGIGNTDFGLTTDPGVGTYVDGVYVSRSVGGVLDVLDVERIEVLRGPQGTLFGRNTIGGALSIVSRKPEDELAGAAEITVGNDGRVNLRGSIDIPLSETVQTSFAFSSKQRDGYVTRPLAGDEVGDEDRQAFRGTLVYTPNDNWDFQISADYTDIDEASAASIGLGFTTAFPDGTPGGAGALGYGLATFTDPTLGPFERIGLGLADLSQYVVNDIEDDVSFGTFPSGSVIEVGGASFIANYHGENFDLKYTGSFRNTEAVFLSDADNSPVALTEIENHDFNHGQTTHELQLTGTAFEGSLKYAAGVYLFDEDGNDDAFVPIFLPAPDLSIGFPIVLTNNAAVDNSSEAAYIQLTYDINETFAATFGARTTEDEKEYTYTQYLASDEAGSPVPFPAPGAEIPNGFLPGVAPLVGTGTGTDSASFDETQFKFGLDATLSDGTLLYYSFSQGFKSGGFVFRYVAAVPEPIVFEPETLDTHEVGVKWQSENDRFRVNAAVFISEYEDIQVTFFDTLGGPVTANAGTADINGFELEIDALLSENLQFNLGYGYLNAEYTSINPVPGLSAAISLDDELVNTPENTLTVGLEYNTQVVGKELAFRLDYTYTDDIFNDSQNSPFLFQEAIDLWNASARLSLTENSDLIVWGENLSDERYITSGNSNFGLGFHSGVTNRPREFGVTYRHRF